jgi:putative ABC transport system permease protein
VSRDYFGAVGARRREGRFFDASDQKSESPAAIVNESFANRNYPGRSAIGARFQFGRWGSEAYWYTIVGVVKEIRDRGVAEELQPAVYRLHEQANQSGDQPSGIVVRTSVDPASIVAAVRQAIWSVDKNQPRLLNTSVIRKSAPVITLSFATSPPPRSFMPIILSSKAYRLRRLKGLD